MRLLDRILTPNEQKILWFVFGLLFIGLLAGSLAHHGKRIAVATERSGETRLIDIRTASPNELERLSGIGPALAARIVEYRETRGFTRTTDLKQVNGVGDRLFIDIRPDLVEFGSTSTDSTAVGLPDINTATREQLEAVPGLGHELSRRILLARRAGVVFRRPSDLSRVKGFGIKKIEKITPYFHWEYRHDQR